MRVQTGKQVRGPERFSQRLRAEFPQNADGVRGNLPPAEFAGVAIAQFAAAAQTQNDMLVFFTAAPGADKAELAAHAQMNQKKQAAGEVENNELAAAIDGGDFPADKPFPKKKWPPLYEGRPKNNTISYFPPYNLRTSQFPDDGFNFGQFRHY
jgi:hypothetical protein